MRRTAGRIGINLLVSVAVFILPSDYWNVRESALSEGTFLLSTRHYDTTVQVRNIPVKGGNEQVTAYVVCRRVQKVRCEGKATPKIHARITAMKVIDDEWNAISASTVQLAAVDRGDHFAVCAWIGGTDGKIYLAVQCSDPNYCGAPDNQSMLMIQVKQVCK